MDDIKCLVCQSIFSKERELHGHLKSHKIKIEEYYLKYYSKKDLLTGEPIPFKNREQYLTTDFLCKDNLKIWFNSSDLENQIKFIESFVRERIERKGLVFIPSQVELKSLMCPSLITIKKIIPNYIQFFENLGLINRLSLKTEVIETNKDSNPILIDTREQSPLFFRYEIKKKISSLPYGDYKLEKDPLPQKLAIERKSLSDFVSTFSTGFDRFKRELDRATNANCYLVVLVEQSSNDALNFKKRNLISPRLLVTEEYVFHNVRSLMQSNKNIQFLFVDSRSEASRLVEKILYFGNLHLKYDLQLEYDLKEL